MKMRYIIGLAVLVALAGSCKKENKETSTFTASVENDEGNSKTHLDGYKVKWTAGDQIIVYGDGDSKTYTLTGGADTQYGTFTTTGGVQPADTYRGFYPASKFSSLSGDNFIFTMPATQAYVANGFDNNLNPMAGKATGGSTVLMFKNAFSILKVNATGNNCPITSIVLSTSGSNYLTGAFVFDYANPETTATTVSGITNGNTITMNVSATLSSSAQSFYFVVPPHALENGFTVTYYDNGTVVDHAFTATASQVTGFSFAPNKINQVTMDVQLQGIRNLLPQVSQSNWNFDNFTYVSGSTNFVELKSNSSVAEAYLIPKNGADLVAGHKYYVRWKSAIKDYNGTRGEDFWWPGVAGYQIVSQHLHPSANLEKYSKIFTPSNATGTYVPRFDLNSDKKEIRYTFGEAMLIDLTAAGLESTSQATLDAKPYFYGITPSW